MLHRRGKLIDDVSAARMLRTLRFSDIARLTKVRIVESHASARNRSLADIRYMGKNYILEGQRNKAVRPQPCPFSFTGHIYTPLCLVMILNHGRSLLQMLQDTSNISRQSSTRKLQLDERARLRQHHRRRRSLGGNRPVLHCLLW